MSDSSKKPARRKPRAAVRGILGVGLDNEDGHKRITTGEKFVLVGGSQETHEVMTETMMKTFEELKRRDKALETVDRRELADLRGDHHRRDALQCIQQQCRRGEALAAGTQDVGRADVAGADLADVAEADRKSTRLNSSH